MRAHGPPVLCGPRRDAFCRGEQFEVSSKERERAARAACRGTARYAFLSAVTGAARECAALPSWENPTWGLFLLIVLCMLVISAAAIAQQFVQRDFIDRVLIPAKEHGPRFWAIFCDSADISAAFPFYTLSATSGATVWGRGSAGICAVGFFLPKSIRFRFPLWTAVRPAN